MARKNIRSAIESRTVTTVTNGFPGSSDKYNTATPYSSLKTCCLEKYCERKRREQSPRHWLTG